MSASKKTNGRFTAYVWLSGLLAVLACLVVWPFVVLSSETSQPLLRGVALLQLVILAAAGIGGLYFERRRKRAIRAACLAEGLSIVDIQTRKTHYRVSLSGPQGSEVRKCRVSRQGVEWIA